MAPYSWMKPLPDRFPCLIRRAPTEHQRFSYERPPCVPRKRARHAPFEPTVTGRQLVSQHTGATISSSIATKEVGRSGLLRTIRPVTDGRRGGTGVATCFMMGHRRASYA